MSGLGAGTEHPPDRFHLAEVLLEVLSAHPNQVADRHPALLRVKSPPLPARRVKLPHQFGVRVAQQLHQRQCKFDVAPKVGKPALPLVLVKWPQLRLLFGNDATNSLAPYELRIAQVNDHIADAPVRTHGPLVQRYLVHAVERLSQARRPRHVCLKGVPNRSWNGRHGRPMIAHGSGSDAGASCRESVW